MATMQNGRPPPPGGGDQPQPRQEVKKEKELTEAEMMYIMTEAAETMKEQHNRLFALTTPQKQKRLKSMFSAPRGVTPIRRCPAAFKNLIRDIGVVKIMSSKIMCPSPTMEKLFMKKECSAEELDKIKKQQVFHALEHYVLIRINNDLVLVFENGPLLPYGMDDNMKSYLCSSRTRWFAANLIRFPTSPQVMAAQLLRNHARIYSESKEDESPESYQKQVKKLIFACPGIEDALVPKRGQTIASHMCTSWHRIRRRVLERMLEAVNKYTINPISEKNFIRMMPFDITTVPEIVSAIREQMAECDVLWAKENSEEIVLGDEPDLEDEEDMMMDEEMGEYGMQQEQRAPVQKKQVTQPRTFIQHSFANNPLPLNSLNQYYRETHQRAAPQFSTVSEQMMGADGMGRGSERPIRRMVASPGAGPCRLIDPESTQRMNRNMPKNKYGQINADRATPIPTTFNKPALRVQHPQQIPPTKENRALLPPQSNRPIQQQLMQSVPYEKETERIPPYEVPASPIQATHISTSPLYGTGQQQLGVMHTPPSRLHLRSPFTQSPFSFSPSPSPQLMVVGSDGVPILLPTVVYVQQTENGLVQVEPPHPLPQLIMAIPSTGDRGTERRMERTEQGGMKRGGSREDEGIKRRRSESREDGEESGEDSAGKERENKEAEEEKGIEEDSMRKVEEERMRLEEEEKKRKEEEERNEEEKRKEEERQKERVRLEEEDRKKKDEEERIKAEEIKKEEEQKERVRLEEEDRKRKEQEERIEAEKWKKEEEQKKFEIEKARIVEETRMKMECIKEEEKTISQEEEVESGEEDAVEGTDKNVTVLVEGSSEEEESEEEQEDDKEGEEVVPESVDGDSDNEEIKKMGPSPVAPSALSPSTRGKDDSDIEIVFVGPSEKKAEMSEGGYCEIVDEQLNKVKKESNANEVMFLFQRRSTGKMERLGKVKEEPKSIVDDNKIRSAVVQRPLQLAPLFKKNKKVSMDDIKAESVENEDESCMEKRDESIVANVGRSVVKSEVKEEFIVKEEDAVENTVTRIQGGNSNIPTTVSLKEEDTLGGIQGVNMNRSAELFENEETESDTERQELEAMTQEDSTQISSIIITCETATLTSSSTTLSLVESTTAAPNTAAPNSVATAPSLDSHSSITNDHTVSITEDTPTWTSAIVEDTSTSVPISSLPLNRRDSGEGMPRLETRLSAEMMDILDRSDSLLMPYLFPEMGEKERGKETIQEKAVKDEDAMKELPSDNKGDADSLMFHIMRGESAILSDDRRRATRDEAVNSCEKALVFSNRPLIRGEKVTLRVIEISPKWKGRVRLGLTTKNPLQYPSRDAIPRQLKPDMSDGHVTYMFDSGVGNTVKMGTVVDIELIENGDELKYSFDGVEMGTLVGGLQTIRPMWLCVDIYGFVKGVEIIKLDTSAQSVNRTGVPSVDAVVDIVEMELKTKDCTTEAYEEMKELSNGHAADGGMAVKEMGEILPSPTQNISINSEPVHMNNTGRGGYECNGIETLKDVLDRVMDSIDEEREKDAPKEDPVDGELNGQEEREEEEPPRKKRRTDWEVVEYRPRELILLSLWESQAVIDQRKGNETKGEKGEVIDATMNESSNERDVPEEEEEMELNNARKDGDSNVSGIMHMSEEKIHSSMDSSDSSGVPHSRRSLFGPGCLSFDRTFDAKEKEVEEADNKKEEEAIPLCRLSLFGPGSASINNIIAKINKNSE